jgi:hypothetical protein
MTYAGKHACRQMASSSAARRRWPPSQAWPHRVASVPCRMRVMRPWRGSPAFRFGDSTTKLTSSVRFLPPRARPPAVDACTLCGAVRAISGNSRRRMRAWAAHALPPARRVAPRAAVPMPTDSTFHLWLCVNKAIFLAALWPTRQVSTVCFCT